MMMMMTLRARLKLCLKPTFRSNQLILKPLKETVRSNHHILKWMRETSRATNKILKPLKETSGVAYLALKQLREMLRATIHLKRLKQTSEATI